MLTTALFWHSVDGVIGGQMTGEPLLGPAGYVITGSGGGGEGGGYMFASLEELDAIIAEWVAVRRDILRDSARYTQTSIFTNIAPADDVMSVTQAKSVLDSLSEAAKHNQSLLMYATEYIEKLREARERYRADDDEARGSVEQADHAS